ncbi:MAG: RNA polymerase sigma factor [Patescibacteria group bacterium]|nr:RNA polymerase sigma factor [Patescibacteria group bacterium]
MNKNDPGVLMKKAKEGDDEAFSLLYEAYFSPVFRYIYFRVQDQAIAEDLTQTVFLKVYEKLPVYEDQDRPPLAYFFTIARNKVIDHWRKNKEVKLPDAENFLAQVPDPAANAEELLSRAGAEKMVSQALEILSEDQREAIILKFINELSNREIADLLDKNEEAVRQLQCRGLRNLREYFQRLEPNL